MSADCTLSKVERKASEIYRKRIFFRKDLRDSYLRPAFSGWKEKIPRLIKSHVHGHKTNKVSIRNGNRILDLGEVSIASQV